MPRATPVRPHEENRMRSNPRSVWLARSVGAFLVVLSLVTSAIRADEDPVFRKSVPENSADLLAIQDRVTELVNKVLPCTVALQVGRAQASGVIVSADGYVLTAAHVIERSGPNVTVILSDGRGVEGRRV